MGNLCCGGDSNSVLSASERRERDAIRLAKEETQKVIKASSVKEEVNYGNEVSDLPTKEFSDSQIEKNIYPAPEYTREKLDSIYNQKPNTHDLKGKKFMNDPNPDRNTPEQMEEVEAVVYGNIYPPPLISEGTVI